MKYIDIHTHQFSTSPNVVSVYSSYQNFHLPESNRFYSVGLHPCYLEDNLAENQFSQIKNLILSANVIAIGECGLDRICDTKWEIQLYWFRKQINLAIENQKPLIIHCVRAFSEVIHELKSQKVNVPVIFHGFNKNQILAEQILTEGYYCSFGKGLQNEKTQNVFRNIPTEKIFLETDSSELPIEQIYTLASDVKGIELDTLKKIIAENSKAVFGNILSLS